MQRMRAYRKAHTYTPTLPAKSRRMEVSAAIEPDRRSRTRPRFCYNPFLFRFF